MPFVTLWVPGWEDLEHWAANIASNLQGNDNDEGNTIYDSLCMLIMVLVPICMTILLWRQIPVYFPRNDARASARATEEEEGTPPPYSVSVKQLLPGAQRKVGVPIYSKGSSHRRKRNQNDRKIRNLKWMLNAVAALNMELSCQLRSQNKDLDDGKVELETLKHELHDSRASIEALDEQLENSNYLIDTLDQSIASRNAHINQLNGEVALRDATITHLNRQIALWETRIQNHLAKSRGMTRFADSSFRSVMRMGRLADELAPLHLPVRVATAVTEFQRVRDNVMEMRRQLIP